MADAIQNIRLAYRALLQNDSQLSHLRKKLADGDLAALQKYSMRAGQLAVNALKESAGNESINQLSVKEALDSVFRENYDAVVNASTAAQKAHNEASGIDLNASVSDYSDENVQALADRVISHEDLSEGISSITNDIVVQSQRYADDSERRSAEFENDSGLEVLVTREYDDVGVHTTDRGGGDVCQWCLSRCGTDVPYQEAYEKGMFERHPGCGCVITYKTKRGILRQGKGDWQNNSWSEVPESVRDKRIDFSESGDNNGSSLKTSHQREFEAELTRQGTANLHDVILENPKALGDYTPSSLKQTFEKHGFNVIDFLGQGDFKGISFDKGGGYRVLFGGDGTFRYHPGGRSHHGGEYY